MRRSECRSSRAASARGRPTNSIARGYALRIRYRPPAAAVAIAIAIAIAASFFGSGAIDTACLAHIAAPTEIDAFPTTFAREAPVPARKDALGRTLSANDRRVIALVRGVVSDTLWRWWRLGLARLADHS
jgi:hypothetical protein